MRSAGTPYQSRRSPRAIRINRRGDDNFVVAGAGTPPAGTMGPVVAFIVRKRPWPGCLVTSGCAGMVYKVGAKGSRE
jgi:hypothetical protein